MQNDTVAAEPSGPIVYTISFIPNDNMLETGNEPLLILRELSELGEVAIKADCSRIPGLDAIQPESCYVQWGIELTTDKGREKIDEVFEFVDGECALTIESQAEEARSAPPATPSAAMAPPAAANAPATAGPAKPASVKTIRVDIDKVDRMVNMVGELVITQAMLFAQTKDIPVDQHPMLLRGIEELSQHTRELQEAVMSLRMQAVKSVFSRMPRLVRDLSTQLGKDIEIEMSGENTEIDKTMIEQLGDPLTHMIRNSIDHGIEMPEDRVAKGKPAQGNINLLADSRGGRIIIEISDDGAGINREKVLGKAKEKGVVSGDVTLTDEEIDNLIFMPGFSTADQVSNISGRGVGMDVVRKNIEGLGGTVHITSKPGEGSVFTVSLPLTLAILDGMVVGAGAEQYIIPIANIIETMRPRKDEVHKIAEGNDLINVRGEFIPLHYLYKSFNIANAIDEPSEALVVLVESGRDKMGVVVDELVGQQQVVIKSLEENSDPVGGVSGATILGDGHVSLILDIAQLYHMTQNEQGGAPVPPPTNNNEKRDGDSQQRKAA